MFRLVRGVFRRVVWLGTGASIGFGGAMWIRHRLLRLVGRDVPRKVRGVGVDVRAALAEGRAEMHARETQLRTELAPGRRGTGA
jgi:hypothetical protein